MAGVVDGARPAKVVSQIGGGVPVGCLLSGRVEQARRECLCLLIGGRTRPDFANSVEPRSRSTFREMACIRRQVGQRPVCFVFALAGNIN